MKLNLETVGSATFFMSSWEAIKKDKGILLAWTRDTEVSNVRYLRLISLVWGWPPVRHEKIFMSVAE